MNTYTYIQYIHTIMNNSYPCIHYMGRKLEVNEVFVFFKCVVKRPLSTKKKKKTNSRMLLKFHSATARATVKYKTYL